MLLASVQALAGKLDAAKENILSAIQNASQDTRASSQLAAPIAITKAVLSTAVGMAVAGRAEDADQILAALLRALRPFTSRRAQISSIRTLIESATLRACRGDEF